MKIKQKTEYALVSVYSMESAMYFWGGSVTEDLSLYYQLPHGKFERIKFKNPYHEVCECHFQLKLRHFSVRIQGGTWPFYIVLVGQCEARNVSMLCVYLTTLTALYIKGSQCKRYREPVALHIFHDKTTFVDLIDITCMDRYLISILLFYLGLSFL